MSKKAMRRKSEKNELRAPRSWKLERADAKGGSASFETYFMRDLYQKGEIDDELIAEIIEQNQLSVAVDDVVEALEDPTGDSIPRGLSARVADLAHVIVDAN